MRPSLLAAFALSVTASAQAQNPFRHYSEAAAVRFADSQPILAYTLTIDTTDLSTFAVEIRIRNAPDTFRLGMVAHPEYNERYWRYVEAASVSGATGGSITAIDSALWQVVAPGGASTISYRIRLPAPSAGFRSGWVPFLSRTGGLTGGPHVFMYVVGATLAPAHVRMELPAEWSVATGLESTADPHTFFAPSAFVLSDSPLLVGKLRTWRFSVDGVPHKVAYWDAPNATPFDTAAVVDGLSRLAQEAIALFGRAPYRDYTFQLQDSALGSLEHLNSVSMGAPSARLATSTTDFFAEAAHEFVHTWNLMRIRPIEYADVQYRTPRRSRGLWWSEGITMHYADLLLRRAGLPTRDSTRLAHVEALIGRYLAQPGHARFSAESVSVVSYGAPPGVLGDYAASTHLQGELMGNMLDLMVRDATSGRRSLDDVTRLMLQRFSGVRGFTGHDIERAVADVCRCAVHTFFQRHVRTGNALDFNQHLARAGLRIQIDSSTVLDAEGRVVPDLRVFAWDAPGDQGVRLWLTHPGSVWAKAGLHTGDPVLAVNGVTLRNAAQLRELRSTMRVGDTVKVELRRPSGPRTVTFVMTGYQRPTARIEQMANATERQARLRDAWLVGSSSPL